MTIVFGLYIGAIAAIIILIIYMIVDKKDLSNAGMGALVGFLVGLLVYWIMYALGVVLVNLNF